MKFAGQQVGLHRHFTSLINTAVEIIESRSRSGLRIGSHARYKEHEKY